MDFYTTLGEYYDLVFPFGQRQGQFFQGLFQQYHVKSVLDVACGTGSYTLEFARWNLRAVGVDLNAQMITQARHKAQLAGMPVSFLVADMTQLPAFNPPFEAVICIGNSLVHLLTPVAILEALQGFAKNLHDQGLLVIQIVNYDRIIDQQLPGLPTINRPEANLRFERKYFWQGDGLIEFRSQLTVGDQQSSSSVRLLPIRQQPLENLMREAGFEVVGSYGGFAPEPPTDQSQALVVVAQKSS